MRAIATEQAREAITDLLIEAGADVGDAYGWLVSDDTFVVRTDDGREYLVTAREVRE